MQNSQSQPPNPSAARSATPATSWSLPEIRNVSATLCARVFSPFSSVICCFVSDLGGPKAVANWLADFADAATARDLPTVPRILLVVETTSDTFDESIATSKAIAHLQQASHTNDCVHENQLDHLNIGEIEVLGLQSYKSTAARARALKRRLLAMSEKSMKERAGKLTQFNHTHVQALTKRALGHISTKIDEPFQLANASRSKGFTTSLLEACLSDFFLQLPSQAWLWHFAAPLVASALLLASYPPGAHNFAPDYLFDALYATPCKAAIATYTMFEDIQHKFISAVLQEFKNVFEIYISNTSSASDIHRETLRTNHTHMASLKSHRTCFSCFLRMPEKVLTCGHALCDPCIRIFGTRCRSERNTFEIIDCILCGVNFMSHKFRFVPPTAGIRMLSIDGGGVRGVIPLVFLQQLDRTLAPLGCAIKDHFDFVCGTSAGGLVAIGMFLLQWDATESIQRYEQVAAKTFGRRKALISRALQLIVAYVEDGQYSLDAVQEAFRKTFNSNLQMFNPLRNDTKVAVTTTAVDDSLPWLFTNYNGGKRPKSVGYDVVRAEKAKNDITVSDA
ncbi:hypothetical protein CUC08_Gglean005691 [Alternaria sp. MG1]|nr:hypothetical protein CUC08_Gglean005691 [Alternaria sp. MG1]